MSKLCRDAIIASLQAFKLFHDRKAVLADTAKRAGPTVGNGLKRGARGDAAIRIAFFWVVDVTADVANVLFHIDVVLWVN